MLTEAAAAPAASGSPARGAARLPAGVWVAGITLLALGLRAGWVALFGTHAMSDAHAYRVLAEQLASGAYLGFDGTPYTYWPVGYPFFLSLSMRLLGPQTWVIPAIEVLASTAIVVLTIILCQQWIAQPRAALLAGALIAFYPLHVQFASVTSSEALFTVLLLGAFCAWGNVREVRWQRAVATGVLLGLAAYVRPVAIPLAGALFAAHLLRWRRGRLTVVPALAAMATCLVVLSPWTYRNYQLYNRLVLVSTNGGMCLFFGNNPDVPGAAQSITYPRGFKGDDAEREAYCKARAVSHIKSDPAGFVKRFVRKAAMLWERDTIGVVWNAEGIERVLGRHGVTGLKLVSQAYWMLLLALCAVAALSLWRTGGAVQVLGHPAILAALILTALHGATYSQDRYHYPCIPLLACLAAGYLAARREARAGSKACAASTWRLSRSSGFSE